MTRPGTTFSGVRLYRALLLGMIASCLILAISPIAIAAPVFRIAVIGEQQNQRVADVTQSLEQALERICQDNCPSEFELSRLASDSEIIHADPDTWDLLVAIGSNAGTMVAHAGTPAPTLYTFLPEVVWRQLVDCCLAIEHEHSALFIDQPLHRQFELIRQVVPDAGRIGVLLGAASSEQREELRRAADAHDFELVVAEIEHANEIGAKLRKLAGEADLLLALPDPAVYNRNTVYSILLTTYSARIPVIGYSSAMVQAGAAAAVFATPSDVGEEIAQWIHAYWQGGKMPRADFGGIFSVTVNDNVIKSLRLRPLSAQALLQQLGNTAP